MKKFIMPFLLMSVLCSAQPFPKDSLYLGQTPPDNTPKIFKLSATAGLRPVERIAITSDGKEIYYSELDTYPPTNQQIKCFKYLKNKWQGPLDVFEGYMGPRLSVDEKTMYMQKNVDGVPRSYYSIRNKSGWSAPNKLLSIKEQSHYYQKTNSGNTYFSSKLQGAPSKDICRLVIVGKDTTVESMGTPINSNANENDFFVAKDESYLIFSRVTPGIAGDMFISFKNTDGKWTNPKKFEAPINSPNWEYGQFVTTDGKYLFFTRGGNDMNSYNIYWVKIDNIIDSLRRSN